MERKINFVTFARIILCSGYLLVALFLSVAAALHLFPRVGPGSADDVLLLERMVVIGVTWSALVIIGAMSRKAISKKMINQLFVNSS